MIKFIINVIEIAVIGRVMFAAGRFLLFRRFSKNKKKSISGKVWQLISTRIHYTLDDMIKAQKAKRPAVHVQQAPSNVIPLKRYKAK